MADQRAITAQDRYVGIRIRARRIELGMSQERLGELVGISFQQVQKYERGLNRIAASRLYCVSQVLELPMHHFFDNATNPKVKARSFALERALVVPGAIELVTLFASMNGAKVRQRVLALVRALHNC